MNEETIVGFLERVGRLGALLRAAAGDRLRALVELRPSGRRVLVDLTCAPVRVTVGDRTLEGNAAVAGSAADLHEVLLGRLDLFEGIGQRRLLLRGSMCHLVSFFPVVGLAPPLYAEHLSRGEAGAARRALARLLGFFLGIAAWLIGLPLRTLARAELQDALDELGRGIARFSPALRAWAAPPRPSGSDHPLAAPRPGAARAAWLRLAGAALRAAGWAVSLLRHGLGVPLDLFALMERLGRGIGRGGGGGA